MKRIVAIAMAVIMIVATSMTALADSVKVALLKLSCEQTFTVSETDQTASIDLEFTYETADGQKTTVDAPHKYITLESSNDAIVLENVVLKEVNESSDYGTKFDGEGEIQVCTNPWPAKIEADGANFEKGKFLLETSVEDTREKEFKNIILTATYKIPANTAKGEYTITATADATDYTEADYADVTADYTLVVAEKVVEPECDHDWEIVSATPAEGTAENVETKKGNIVTKCIKCNEEVTEEVNFEYDYYFGWISAEYASQFNLLFSIRNDDTVLNMKGEYEDMFMYTSHLVSSTNEYTYTYMNILDELVRDTTQGSKNRAAKTFPYGLKSLQLTEAVSAVPFIKVNGIWYSGDTAKYSMRDYADEVLVKDGISDDEKTLVVNMLTYGSKMQTFKGYNIENLADANLEEYSSYITTTIPEISSGLVENPLDKEVYLGKFTLDMADRISVIYQLNADGYSGNNKTDLVVKANWQDANGLDMSAEYTSDDFAPTSREYRYTFTFAELNSYDLRKEVTFIAYDEQTDVSGSFIASVEQILAYGIAKNSYSQVELDVYYAMLNYSDASYKHFITNRQ